MNYLRRIALCVGLLSASLLAGCRSDSPDIAAQKRIADHPEVKTTADGRRKLEIPAPQDVPNSQGDTFVHQ